MCNSTICCPVKGNHQYKLIGLLLSLLILSSCQSRETLFQSISSGDSGIRFNNRIQQNDSTNILEYEYAYNGSGVAVADFNKDGLQDLYFIGNEVNNRLYLNEGNMEFRDVTEPSGTQGFKQWYTGVSIVDINDDGLPDIYVCATRSESPAKRKNVLYINQGENDDGIPVFKNEAEAYGLATTAYSTQAAFFDYDNDGDLDMYEMVADKRRKRRIMGDQAKQNDPANVDHLYRNDWDESAGHPVFTDVSDQAGINKQGYGLGLHIFDINKDGFKDVYISNDFLSNDLLWINDGDGTFTDHARDYFKHTSFSGMGTDAGDLNNDGRLDLVSLDMAGRNNLEKQTMYTPNNYKNYFNNYFTGYDPEFTRNTMQLNQGNIPASDPENSHPIFSDISLLTGIAHTNWSWGVLMADFNNDGHKDLVITNGIPKNKIDKDFVKKRDQIGNVASQSMLLDAIPPAKSTNVAFQNNGDLKFSDVTSQWGLKQPLYSTGMAWADLDNDGDLDLVMNNINDEASLYRNTLNDKEEQGEAANHWLQVKFKGSKRNPQGLGAMVDIYFNSRHQTAEHTVYRGYLSSVEDVEHFGLGKTTNIDSLVVTWPEKAGMARQIWKDINADQIITAEASNASPIPSGKFIRDDITKPVFTNVNSERNIDFVQKEKFYTDFKIQRMLPHQLSQYGPGLAVGDVNGDNREDLFIGGSFNVKGSFLLQQPDGSFRESDLIRGPGGSNKMQEDEGVLFFDADNDGDLDLYIVSGSVENTPLSQNFRDRLYENDGNGHFVPSTNALPDFRESGSAVKAADYDHDGDLDLFVGGRVKPGNYPAPVSSRILRNDSDQNGLDFTDVTSSVAKSLLQVGLVTDALWTDYNNDGWMDLIISGEWMPITILENQKGTFKDVTDQTGIGDKTGWWNSLAAGDFDNDGDTDYIAGNLGTNTIYKASPEHPVGAYAKDFDQNGFYDAVFTIFLPDSNGVEHEYPAHQLNDFLWQIPEVGKEFDSHRDFATSTIHDIFSKKELNDALVYHANHMESSYIENNGDETFKMKSLPTEAQFAPVFGMVVDDFDGDGNLDVLLNGNDYGAEVQVGAYDALNGLLLSGNGKGEFTPVEMQKSGIFIPGNGKSLVKIKGADGGYLVAAGQNQGPLKVYKANHTSQLVQLQPMDSYATLHFKDGTQRRDEFYYGTSFLSASGRFMQVPDKVESIDIYTFDGSHRSLQVSELSSRENGK